MRRDAGLQNAVRWQAERQRRECCSMQQQAADLAWMKTAGLGSLSWAMMSFCTRFVAVAVSAMTGTPGKRVLNTYSAL